MTVVGTVSLAILAVAGVVCVARLLRGGSLADRIVALDTMLTIAVTGVAVYSFTSGLRDFIDLLVVTTLLGFVGTVLVARFMEGRGT